LAIGGFLIALTGAPLRWIVRRSAGLFFLSAGVSGATLVAAGLALIAGAPGPHSRPSVVVPTVLVAVGLLLVAALPAILRARPHGPGWLTAIATGVREAEQTTFTRHPSWRLVGALGYLAFDIAVLWVILRAIGHAPSVAVVTLGYSIGYAANSLPIPGGIGVLDAGLTGALVLYGVSPVHAAAAVIVYHAIAFWVPGLGGLLAYLRLRPRLLRTVPPHPHILNQRQTLSPPMTLAMHAVTLMLKPIDRGWAVARTNGRELVRFTGLCAKRRAGAQPRRPQPDQGDQPSPLSNG
jgi:uncharacterized membrane protein YbhN (UPF0104 family)